MTNYPKIRWLKVSSVPGSQILRVRNSETAKKNGLVSTTVLEPQLEELKGRETQGLRG